MAEYVGRALHMGISVCTMEDSIKWYEEVLGFRLVKDDGYLPSLEARVCFMERDGFQLELFEYKKPIPLPAERLTPNSDLQTVGTKHVAFQVGDMEAMKAHLRAHGADIALEVHMGIGHIMFIRDPDGILIELVQN